MGLASVIPGMRLVPYAALGRLNRSDEYEGVCGKYLGSPGDLTRKLFSADARA